MNLTTDPVAPTRAGRDDRDVRFPWVCLFSAPVVFPLTFVLAFVLGQMTHPGATRSRAVVSEAGQHDRG